MTAWSGFLIATLVEFVVWADRPTGIVDEDTARWLAAALAGDGAVPPTRTARLIAREVAEEAEAFENDAFAALATSGCQARVETRQPAPAPPSHPRPLLGKLGGRAQAQVDSESSQAGGPRDCPRGRRKQRACRGLPLPLSRKRR